MRGEGIKVPGQPSLYVVILYFTQNESNNRTFVTIYFNELLPKIVFFPGTHIHIFLSAISFDIPLKLKEIFMTKIS